MENFNLLKSSVETIVEIESTFDVNSVRYNDVMIWPLVRSAIWSQLLSPELNLTRETTKRLQKIPIFDIAVGIVVKNDQFLVTLRKPEGLLGGLWEFPGGKINRHESAETACIREIKEETNLTVEVIKALPTVKHAYTHFKIQMQPFICRYLSGRVRLNGPVDYRWITTRQIEKFAFPKANHKIFPNLRTYLELSN